MLNNPLTLYFAEAANLIHATWIDCTPDIELAAQTITTSFKSGHKLLICGNGGSAAQSQHMAAELVPLGYPAIALTTDTSFLTAWSNDKEFASVFGQQVIALGQAGDVLLAISTSGESVNVVRAIADGIMACVGIKVIALTGSSVGYTGSADIAIRVPTTSTTHCQEAHLAICHVICELVVAGMEKES